MADLIFRIDVQVLSFILLMIVTIIVNKKVDKEIITVKAIKKMTILVCITITLTIISSILYKYERFHLRYHIHSILYILENFINYYLFIFTYYYIANEKKAELGRKLLMIIPTILMVIIVLANYITSEFFYIAQNGLLEKGNLYV